MKKLNLWCTYLYQILGLNTKITVYPDTFLEFTSVVFSYVDYFINYLHRKFSIFFSPPP